MGTNHIASGTRIEECYNIGEISGKDNIGGIGGGIGNGSNVGYIINCYNSGRIVGNRIMGIVGSGSGIKTISCYNLGELEGTTKYGISNKGNIENCYYLANNGTSTGNAVGVTNEEMKEKYVLLDRAFTIDDENNVITISETEKQNVWIKDDKNKNSGYPIFNWQ